MKRLRGFTLIELMIAVAVIGFLVAIAYPSYQDSVRRSNRGTAQAFMMDVAQREQALLLDRRSYAAAANNAAFPGAVGIAVPPDVSDRYNMVITTTATPPTFTITATAKGTQLKDKDLVLKSDGTKTRGGQASLW